MAWHAAAAPAEVSTLPRHPVYIPSKGRAATCLTAKRLVKDGVPFRLVVERQDADEYAARFGAERLLVLPFQDRGLHAARNWIKDHSIDAGAERHWQLDDNMDSFFRRWRTKRIRIDAGLAMRLMEDFVGRYENVGLAGPTYTMNVPGARRYPPFTVNNHVYSASLITNALPLRWRTRLNDDTDYCLQVLASGWCTLLFNAFMVAKRMTMTMAGGNTAIYQADGRLKMARALERLWPGVVTVSRRFQRPQHVVAYDWRRFTTPLRLRPGVELAELPKVDEHGMRLVELAPVRSELVRGLVAEHAESVLLGAGSPEGT
jgi:TET-Associated Glycosyltransferase